MRFTISAGLYRLVCHLGRTLPISDPGSCGQLCAWRSHPLASPAPSQYTRCPTGPVALLTSSYCGSLLQAKGKPYVIVFVGVNGVGKSTNLAKVAYWLLQNHVKVRREAMLASGANARAGKAGV